MVGRSSYPSGPARPGDAAGPLCESGVPMKTADDLAERMLLGALLQCPALALAGCASAGLWAGAFSSHRLGHLYAHIQQAHGQHQALEDLATLDMPYYELLALQCDFADTTERGRDRDFERFIQRKLQDGISEPMPNAPLDVTAYSLARRIVACAMARRKIMEAEALASGIDQGRPTRFAGGVKL